MLTRRRMIAVLAALPVQSHLAAQIFPHRRKPTAAPQPLVYIGTDTARDGAKGLYVCRFDPVKGRLTAPEPAASTFRPAFMARNVVATAKPTQTRTVMYVANEGEGKTSTLSTFLVNTATGALSLLGQVSAGGNGPCYVSVDETGKSVFVANYSGGSVASYKVLPDGTLSEPVDRIDFHDALFGHHGPNTARQDGPHPHSATVSPDNRFVVVNDLGNDQIAIFPITLIAGHLGTPQFFRAMPPGSGPRHIAFHPNGRWAYGINELASRLDQYLFTSTHAIGSSVEAQAALTNTSRSVSTLDAGFSGINTAAEVTVSSDGDFLYASNRGENTLVVFAIDSTNGALTFCQRIACGGKTPRHFTLDPTGKWLLCGNQDSASVTIFGRNPSTGLLTGPVQTVAVESPMYTLFV
jgi:6-phosphogluconolactonase